MDTDYTTTPSVEQAGKEAPASPAAAGAEAAPPARRRRKGGGNRARDARRRGRVARQQAKAGAEKDPFADEVRGTRPADEPTDPTPEAAAAEAPAQAVVVEETPAIGTEAARALAPGYYKLINFASSLVIKNAPAMKGNPREAARIAKAVQLDARGHYEGEMLTNASEDRAAIDPALVPVLAKLRLTSEWALVLVTGAVVLGKYALASGDAEALEILSLVNPTPEPAAPAA
jgi:hypothetical protein